MVIRSLVAVALNKPLPKKETEIDKLIIEVLQQARM